MYISLSPRPILKDEEEFVERKGMGHPDTLSDALAEALSVKYSNYTLRKYGAVLHHNFDKVGLLGGSSRVEFGRGYMVKPIRVLLNGRASTRFGNEVIPVDDLLVKWSREFMETRLPLIDAKKNLEFQNNLSTQSSPGGIKGTRPETSLRAHWFEPRSLEDLQERKILLSNDTSMGIGYAPYTKLERLVIDIENTLNEEGFKRKNPWIGSDIKIMGFKDKQNFYLTICIPQIANYVHSVDEYKKNIAFSRKIIYDIASKLDIKNLDLSINTRDNFDATELYLTAIGSSIESGDEGLVGRGNRVNGVISPNRPMSLEGACGKNPIYHIGKVYYCAADKIANEIYRKFGIANEVYLVSQSGRKLTDPWVVVVKYQEGFKDLSRLKSLVKKEIKSIPLLTNEILNARLQLY